MRFLLILISISISIINLYSQQPRYIDFYLSENNDTIFTQELDEIKILSFKNINEKNEYYYLRRKVLRVYPYAIKARNELLEIEKNITNMKRRKKRKYIRSKIEDIKNNYSDKLKNLTMSEGRILVKLIYRETNYTSYNIVKMYRGRFNAFFWQTIARLWDNNLKTVYDPVNIREDIFIENIILVEKLEERYK
tara:strand:+ start:2790 stop:3368 length:579 start_codon:yes stop_codon:yes gene_type:complete